MRTSKHCNRFHCRHAHVLLGVSGSVATIKLKELFTKLSCICADVKIVYTEAAQHFFDKEWDLGGQIYGEGVSSCHPVSHPMSSLIFTNCACRLKKWACKYLEAVTKEDFCKKNARVLMRWNKCL